MQIITKEKKQMEEKIIYSKRVAYELRKLGFRIIRLDVNPHFPQFNTYVFLNTSEFQEALDKLLRK